MAARPRGCRVATGRHRHRRHGHGEPGREHPRSDGSREWRAESNRGISPSTPTHYWPTSGGAGAPPSPALFLEHFVVGSGCGLAMGWQRLKPLRWGVTAARGWHQSCPGYPRLQGDHGTPPGRVGTSNTSPLLALLPESVLTGRPTETLPGTGGGQASPCCTAAFPLRLHGVCPCTTCPPHNHRWGPPSRSPTAWERVAARRTPPPDGDANAKPKGCHRVWPQYHHRRRCKGLVFGSQRGPPQTPPQCPGEGTRPIWTMMVGDGWTHPRALPA